MGESLLAKCSLETMRSSERDEKMERTFPGALPVTLPT